VSSGGGEETCVDMKESLWKDSIPRDDNDNRAIPVIEKIFWTRWTNHVIPLDKERPEAPVNLTCEMEAIIMSLLDRP
jgi:hypothetical protein